MQDARFIIPILVNAWFLKSFDLSSRRFDGIITREIQSNRIRSADLVAYRRLELEWLLDAAGYVFLEPARFRYLYESCESLWKLPHEWHLSDWYAIPHIVFYATNYGMVEATDRIALHEKERLLSLLLLLGDMAASATEVDVLAEVLLAGAFLGSLKVDTLRHAVGKAESITLDDGGIPTHSIQAGETHESRCYHATLLWAYALETLEAAMKR